MKGKKILVVGASGQVGEALVRALAPENEVTALSRFSNESTRRAVADLGARTIARDLAGDAFEEVSDEYDVVFNQAVNWPGHAQRGRDLALEVNGYLQGRLMERTPSAIHIYGSTMSVPDNAPPLVDEMTAPRRRPSIYGATKLVGESLTVHLSNFRYTCAAILRYMWPVGSPLLRGPDALLDLVRQVIKGERMELERCLLCQPPDGRETKEIIGSVATPLHVDDVASLSIKAVEAATRPPEVIHVFGPVVPLSDVIRTIEQVFGAAANVEVLEPKTPARIPCYSREKMLRLLGERTITLPQILQRLKARMKESGEME